MKCCLKTIFVFARLIIIWSTKKDVRFSQEEKQNWFHFSHYTPLIILSYVTSLKAQFDIRRPLKIEKESEKYICTHSFSPLCVLVHRTLFEIYDAFSSGAPARMIVKITTSSLIFYGHIPGIIFKIYANINNVHKLLIKTFIWLFKYCNKLPVSIKHD
jgi:hypothetical protein